MMKTAELAAWIEQAITEFIDGSLHNTLQPANPGFQPGRISNNQTKESQWLKAQIAAILKY